MADRQIKFFVFILMFSLCSVLLGIDKENTALADSTRGRLYYEAHLEYSISNPVLAIEYLKKSSELYKKAKRPLNSASALARIGQLYSNLGLHHLALEYLFEAFTFFSSRVSDDQMAWLYSDIANVYFAMNQIDIAEPYYWSGLKVMENTGNEYGQSVMLNNIGLCKINAGYADSSLVYFERSYKLRTKLNMEFGRFHTLFFIAGVKEMLGSMDEAEQMYLQIFEGLQNPDTLINDSLQLRANAAGMLFTMYHNRGEVQKARYYLEISLQTLRNIGDIFNLTNLLVRKAILLEDDKNYAGAEKLLLEAYDLSSKNSYINSAKLAAGELVSLYFKIQKYPKAQYFFEKYSAYYDSLYASKSSDNLVRLHSLVQSHVKEVEHREQRHRQIITIRYLSIVSILAALLGVLGVSFVMSGRKNLKRLRQLAEASFEGIVLHDNGIIMDVNTRFLELFKLNREQCTGTKLSDLIGDDGDHSYLQGIDAEGVHNYEATVTTAVGNTIDVEVMSRPYTYQRREVRVAAIRDVTEKKQFIKSIIEAQTQLRELNSTKDKLLSIIAHDLKNPFNAIIGFSELMLRNLKSFKQEDIVEMLEMIHESSVSAHKLLENLLDWARVQIGSFSFKPCESNLADLVGSIVSLHSAGLKAKDISLKIDVAQDIKVYADVKMWQIIMNNLFTNAIKFTHRGGSIEICAGYDNGTFIKVCDTGVGMNEEQMNQLFAFKGLQSSVGTENEQGTGLGLVLCKDLLKLHNGSIRAEKNEPSGTCFEIYFPMLEQGETV